MQFIRAPVALIHLVMIVHPRFRDSSTVTWRVFDDIKAESFKL